ncbi:HNH endonuclease [Nakamurella lactea]|uniref:HNH endonuclease n=1 Tax=Nakamurella lactea TaxID=459515 RepID=UPI0004149CF6|nr:HNH endonuclease [Nakamurella lactea]
MNEVLLINSSYQVLSRIEWQRAVSLVVTGEAETFEAHPTKVIHSQHLSIPLPKIIRMLAYVHIGFRPALDRQPTFAQIKLRDSRTCGYCGRHGDTIDHIIPQSKGGPNTWENLITSCRPCNNRKADRTPVQAGMKLLWLPRPVLPDTADQEYIWSVLANSAA